MPLRVFSFWSPSAVVAASVLLVCAGLSGAAALMYEVLWNRELLVLFGSTTAATAAVVAAFMAGMAIGARLLGQYVDRLRGPLLVYAGLELAIAAYALAFPSLLFAASALYIDAWQAGVAHPLMLSALRLGVGFALLAPPTLAMGATLPLLVQIIGQRSTRPFRIVAWIYAVNAAGGALGAGAAGLLLLPRFGVSTSYGSAIGLSVMAASIAALLWWSRSKATVRLNTPPTTSRAHDPQATPLARVLFPTALLLAGVAALGYEVVWTRMLVLVTGSSAYAFTLMLVVYISGLSLGSLWIARHVDRLRSPGLTFAHLQIGVAVSVAAGLWLFGHVPDWLLAWYRQIGFSFISTLAAQTAAATTMMFLPTFLLGAAFPVAVRVMQPVSASTARETGRVYAWITAGNVLGALAAGGIFIALLGLQGSLLALAGIGAFAGLLCAVMERRAVRARWTTLAAGVLVVLLGALVQPRWDPLVMTSGVYKEAPLYLDLTGGGERWRNILGAYRLLYYAEGAQAVVSVVERPTLERTPHRVLAIDGKVDASTGADMSTQVLSGHLPALVHPAPRRVLVIGLASAVTVGAVEQHSNVEQITVAEIEPVVVDAARQFTPFNHDALADPRLRLVLDDGRHYLGVTEERFDVVISEPSNPWLSGPARLFTQEFFQTVRDRLNEDGIFAQWLPLYGLSTPLLQAEIRTFLRVFPHAALFHVSAGDLLLLGSSHPLQSWDDASLSPGVAGDLARVGSGAEDLLARFVTGERGLAPWVGDGPVNTDDNGLTEFGAPRFLLEDTLQANRAAIFKVPCEADLARWIATDGYSAPAKERVVRFARAYLAAGRLDCAEFLASMVAHAPEATAILGDIAAREGDGFSARRLWQRADTPSALLQLGEAALKESKARGASDFLGRIPVTARTARFHYVHALTRMLSKEDADALRALARVPVSTASGWQILAPYLRAVTLERLGDSGGVAQEAREQFLSLVDQLRGQLEREEGQQTMDELLREIDPHGRLVLAEKEYRELQQSVRSRLLDPLAVYYRGVSLLWLGEPAKAIAVLDDYLGRLPLFANESSHARVLLDQAYGQTVRR